MTATDIADTIIELERRVASQEAELVLRKQDVKGCEDMFEALNVPERTPGGARLRPTGRANALLGMHRALYVAASAVVQAYEHGDPVDADCDLFAERLDDLARAVAGIPVPEAP